ncbi:elongin-A3 member B isoform X2 [Nomascus leucogenys]|uniref:elongin-A3 member B isoform X2 n=1 Tax=Nomascus leucogenys TaxID=61853 RepID=UPI00122D6332|nr:elongin-A3 member B isoform X2 [Nomascus leucogenys]
MAAGSTTLRAVEKLQVRLATKTDPRKLEKYLQKLSALPMTADILAETGIRKAVKRLRKHQHVGDFARDLAARWKKLVLVDRNTGPDPQDPEESASRQRFGEALQDQEKARGFPENATAPRSPSHSPEHRRTARRTPPGQQRPHPRSPSREPRAERKRPRMAPADSGPQRAPPTRTAPLPMPEGPEPVMRGKQPGRGHAHAAQVGPLLGPGCQGKPQGEAVVSHSKEYKSSRQESAQKSPPVQESQSERLLEAGADSAGPKTVPSHGFSELWHLSEAWMQANYDQLSDCDSMNFQAKPEALCAPKFQEEAALPGRRVNAKMQVYSGSRTACQPQVLTLRQQCVRVLRNNPDAISDVGEVPYWVLGPILEGWSPDQLYRREKDNHALIRETDELWRIHCLQDYKEEKPQEHESWRELYLRLPDAREQRLRVVTTNIRSARENNPNSREAKIICFNSLAKTSHDASRRKEKSAGAADPGNGEIKPAPKPAGSSQAPSRWSASGLGEGSGSSSGGSSSSGGGSSNEHRAPAAKTRKQAAKKVAPLMAKAVRDYKRRFSRR